MAKLLTSDELMEGENAPMIIERTILQRTPEGKKINPLDYETLLLDGISCPDIFDKDRKFLSQFTCCVQMSFNSSQLKVLTNFPFLEKLVRLELQDNKILTGLNYIAERCPSLEILKLTNNYISSVSEVAKLAPLRATLFTLDLLGNPVCE